MRDRRNGSHEMTKGLWVCQAGTETSWIELAGLGWGGQGGTWRGCSGMGKVIRKVTLTLR